MSDEPRRLPSERGQQFSVRALFLATFAFAVFYGCLNWFGLLAHVVVWLTLLLMGPIIGVVLGIRRLPESDPIIKAVQAGAIGGGLGFVVACLLLLPAHVERSLRTIVLVVVVGSQAAFAFGGLLGFAGGVVRSVVKHFGR